MIELLTLLPTAAMPPAKTKPPLRLLQVSLALFLRSPQNGEIGPPPSLYRLADPGEPGRATEGASDPDATEFPRRAIIPLPASCVGAFGLAGNAYLFRSSGSALPGLRLWPDTRGPHRRLRISGDYLASGIDGIEIYVHGNAQDQLGQIINGEARRLRRRGPDLHVRRQGRRGLRPGQRRRTALDQCRGPARGHHQRNGPRLSCRVLHGRRPHEGGGFVIVNGMTFDHRGRV